jgi:hypothetical protein
VLIKRLSKIITLRMKKGAKSKMIESKDLRGGLPTIAIVNMKKQIIL